MWSLLSAACPLELLVCCWGSLERPRPPWSTHVQARLSRAPWEADALGEVSVSPALVFVPRGPSSGDF